MTAVPRNRSGCPEYFYKLTFTLGWLTIIIYVIRKYICVIKNRLAFSLTKKGTSVKSVNETIVFADDNQREQFLKAVLIQSRIAEEPIEESVLRDKLAGVAADKWNLELLRILKDFEFKAKWFCYELDEKSISELPLPFIVRLNGSFVVVMKRSDKQALVYSIEQNRPIMVSTEEFKQQWDGYAFFMTPKLKLNKLPKRFNLQWFLPVFWKFKRHKKSITVPLLLKLLHRNDNRPVLLCTESQYLFITAFHNNHKTAV